MSDIIKLLPDSIANQIAAGEVVQRPASVVKELMENAVDANSTHIQVIIKEGGKGLIQVVDNGQGMTPADALLSFERHATSKLRKSEDLFAIRTMGFRGEALASIAAVAQVTLKSKTKEADLGTCITIEGSDIKTQEPVACQDGTSISVKNLFFNVPARRNFLKSNSVEMRNIIEDFQRIALANPEIRFSLYQNDLEVYRLPPGKLGQRIVALFGKNYREQLVACREETTHVKIKGYVGTPENAKKTRGEQYFFVNNRFIKNPYLNHAVMNAYEGLLPAESYPFYVLFIDLEPGHIDINVHPTKTEIKFDDERTVYAIVRAAVKQSLGTHNIMPALDFGNNINLQGVNTAGKEFNQGVAARKSYESFKKAERENSNLADWERLYEEGSVPSNFDFSGKEEENEGGLIFESKANSLPSASPGQHPVAEEKTPFQVHDQYIATQVKSGLMFIDQQAAHERILYEKFSGMLEKNAGSSQQFLFPQTIKFNPSDFALVMELEKEISALGFQFNVFGKNDIMITGGPADITGADEKKLFEGLIEQFKRNKSELSINNRENVARSMARRSAIKPGQKLSNTEMKNIIDQLFACTNPNYSPNGQNIFFILTLDKISNLFNR